MKNSLWSLLALAIILAGPGSTAGQDITSGLMGRWRLTETSGATATDSCAAPHHGTYTGGVSLASSSAVPADNAISATFDGADDYVAIPSEATFDFTGAMTVAAWIKVDVFDVAEQAIVCKGDTAWRLQRDLSNNGVAFTCRGLTTNRIASTASVNDGQWHHVVGVYTSGQLRIYVDGALSNSVASFGFISTNNFAVEIGRNGEMAGREFDGAIYDVRVYNRALTGTDIIYLYTLGGPVGHWKLSETSGTTAADSSLFKRNGTLTGMATWAQRCDGTQTFNFDGINQYFTVANASHLQPTAALTITAWICGDTWGLGNDVDVIIRKGEGNPNNYQLAIADGRVALYLDASDPQGIRGNTTLAAGQWYHVAATWDGSSVRIYLDGQLDNMPAARSGSIGVDSRPLYIGGYASSDLFDGMIQEVRLYPRALSHAEIAKLVGFIGHWRFAEGSGTSAADSTALANNATLSGGATWSSDCANNNSLVTNGTGGIAQTATAFTPPSVGTISFWMRGAGTPATRGRVLGVNGDWEIRQEPTGVLAFDLGGSPYLGNEPFSTLSAVDSVGQWYHIAAVFGDVDNSFSVYVDGQLRSSGISPVDLVPQLPGILSFGTRTGSTEYWLGALRDVRIYSRKLCPTEIATLSSYIGHWTFEETTGTNTSDVSLNANNATYQNNPTLDINGPEGRAVRFNGTNYAITTQVFNPPAIGTVSLWMRRAAPSVGRERLFGVGNDWEIWQDPDGFIRCDLCGDGNVGNFRSTTSMIGSWYHIAACFNATTDTYTLYINGVVEASGSMTMTPQSAAQLTIAGRTGLGIERFQGDLDDVRIYNRILCPAEVQAIHDGGEPFDGVKIIKWVEIQ